MSDIEGLKKIFISKGIELDLTDFISKYREIAHVQLEERKETGTLFSPSFETTALQGQIHKLEDRQDLTEARVDQLEFQTNVMPFKDKLDKITDFVVKTFSDLGWIRNISYHPIGHGLRLLFIHELDNRIEALNQIQKRFFQIEDAFSGIYFEHVVLHISQLEPEILKNIKTVLQK